MLLRYVVIFLRVLVAASNSVIRDGQWAEDAGPQLGRVYWVRKSVLGIKFKKPNEYAPCVVLRRLQVGNMYRVVRISPKSNPLVSAPSYYAHLFFGIGAMLQTTLERPVSMRSYYIFPHEKYDVQGEPSIIRERPGHITIMPTNGLVRLRVESGMVDGWKEWAQSGPLIGGIYWIRTQVLNGEITEIGVYTPCVVVHRIGNKYRVVMISPKPDMHESGQPAKLFFWDGAKLQTGHDDLVVLNNYYIYHQANYDVEGDAKTMHRWEDGDVTIMPPEDVVRLEALVDLEHGHHWMGPHHQLGLFSIPRHVPVSNSSIA